MLQCALAFAELSIYLIVYLQNYTTRTREIWINRKLYVITIRSSMWSSMKLSMRDQKCLIKRALVRLYRGVYAEVKISIQ